MRRLKWLAIAALIGAAIALAGPTTALEKRPGAAYQNGFPSDPSYFPIGVWLQQPNHAQEFQAIGINLFVGLLEGAAESQLAELARYGMPVIARQNDDRLRSSYAGIVRGWMQDDEPDNAQSDGKGGWGPCIPAAAVAARSAEIKAKDPTRPVYINFGRGLVDQKWPGRGPCTGDIAYYDEASVGADILSFDIYPVADSSGRLDAPAQGVARLRAAARDDQSVWAVLETTHGGKAMVTPEQLRSEALLALIAGANGLTYFVHEWAGGFREDAIFRYPAIAQAVGELNALIRRLAPVLNSPTIEGRVTASATIPVATMLKQRDGDLYLFAGSTGAGTGSASFKLSGVPDGRAVVIGEDRLVAISNGVLADTFVRGYDVHIYRIAGGA
jgi:hypothetical protein